ncbi:MAG: phosphoribosylanthranilate isomerase [Eubacterium sp.]|nr:phosphoribosylanthranilate isomerase [Eubacterium sp.]
MTKIKICGLKRKEDIEYVNELKPSFIGFVFADSKRKVDKVTAKELKSLLNDDIMSVGVFVDKDIDFVVELVKDKVIDIIQLHGNEDENYISSLKEKLDDETKIIKAVKVKSSEDILKARELDIDYLLLDTYAENTAGGSGKEFDKTLIPADMDDYFLAGGLNETNLEKTIATYHPFAVDLSSGVETDGVKDRDKIRRVIDIVKNTK